MEYILLAIGFAAGQAYASSVRRRNPMNMPVWWGTSESGRLALGLLDFLVLILTIALGIWGFITVQWWAVILIFFASGFFLGSWIISRLEPFSVAFFCGIALIIINLVAWT